MKYFLDNTKSGLLTIMINLIQQQSILIILFHPDDFLLLKKSDIVT